MSPYQLHVQNWKDCTRCGLCDGRLKVVLARGKVPCDVLFVGEAPGESENVIGQPFVGPAGKLLDSIIVRAIIGHNVTYALTNLVACIPRDDSGTKTSEPDSEAIKACAPRLVEFIKLCNPELIVRVGKLAQDYLTPGYKHSIKLEREYKFADITHPAAIIRANVAQQTMAIQRCVVTIANAVKNL